MGLDIDYVLAGHFHTRFDVRKIENGGHFVYPGSPVSITKREVGLRKVNLFEVGGPPKEYQLDSPHYENIVVELDPYEGKNPIDLVVEHLKQTHPQAQVILTVKGYFNSKQIRITESELTKQIDKIAGAKCVDKHLEFVDIHRILENDLYKSFLDHLESTNYSEEKKKVLRQISVRAMMKAEL